MFRVVGRRCGGQVERLQVSIFRLVGRSFGRTVGESTLVEDLFVDRQFFETVDTCGFISVFVGSCVEGDRLT